MKPLLYFKVTFYTIGISLSLIFSLMTSALADGVVVDKVYHPYVLPNEQEIEWRLFSHRESKNNQLAQRFAYGRSISNNAMLEFYFVGEQDSDDNFRLTSYEVEVRWMLTEQGEFWADWGVLFEIEQEHQQKNWEITTGVLFEKEFGRTSLTLNAFLIHEWGQSIESEFETEFRMKYRYRYLEQVQPAIELYSGENYIGIGPALQGLQRFDGQKQLKWEFGFITGLNRRSKGHVLRVALEYEF